MDELALVCRLGAVADAAVKAWPAGVPAREAGGL